MKFVIQQTSNIDSQYRVKIDKRPNFGGNIINPTTPGCQNELKNSIIEMKIDLKKGGGLYKISVCDNKCFVILSQGKQPGQVYEDSRAPVQV